MILTNELKWIIVSRGYTQGKIARQLGISPKTFSEKMKKGVFYSSETEVMIVLLDIKNPCEIFLQIL